MDMVQISNNGWILLFDNMILIIKTLYLMPPRDDGACSVILLSPYPIAKPIAVCRKKENDVLGRGHS